MPRPEKVQAVSDIKEWVEAAKAVFFTEYRGLTVKQIAALRRNLRKTGADYRVVKMTLARRAVTDLGFEGIESELVGPTALTFANQDAVATAKALRDFTKESDRLVLKGALLGKVRLAPGDVTKLADVEPREVLLARLAGAIEAPLAKAAGLFGSFTRNAASMFSQLIDQKKSASPEGA
ncbi:MAG TPA: 50S ribosomal protein L10 [Acidimicrobiia bacterium]